MQVEISSAEFEKQKAQGVIVESKGQKYLVIQGILFVLRDDGKEEINENPA